MHADTSAIHDTSVCVSVFMGVYAVCVHFRTCMRVCTNGDEVVVRNCRATATNDSAEIISCWHS